MNRIARAASALISFDVNYRPSLWASPAQALAQISAMIPKVDLLKVNEVEIELLAGGQNPGGTNPRGRPEVGDLTEMAGRLLAQGPELVVVTLGADGSYFQTASASGFVPPFSVETVDAVGCGDAFIAGVLTQLTAGDDWRAHLSIERLAEILRYANAVGALTATKQGVIPALPTAEEVRDFLDSIQSAQFQS